MITIGIEKNLQNKSLSEILFPIKEELLSFDENLLKNIQSSNEFLNQILEYTVRAGGKRLRPAVLYLMAKTINNGLLEDGHVLLAQSVELVHMASLIHDDIIDNAKIRHSQLTISKKWNEKLAVIAGDFLLAQALKNLGHVKNTEVVSVFASTMTGICEGEIQQNSQQKQILTIDDYIEKSKRKTAILFAAGTESAALTLTNDEKTIRAAKDYAINYGICFQITDDILNFTENSEKPTGNDIASGIYTAPLLFALDEYGVDSELYRLVNKEDLTLFEINRVTELVKSSNGIEKARELALSYVVDAVNNLSNFQDSIYKQALIELAYFTLNRKK